MATGNFNMDDPSKQEAIRRQHHEYIPTAGKHGSYIPKPYKHQEYPKMMGKWECPQLAQFKKQNGVDIPQDLAQAQFDSAMKEWDGLMSSSIVNNKAEELAWLKENG